MEEIKEAIEAGKKNDDFYFEVVDNVAKVLPKSVKDQLRQLVNGPIFDGNLISKTDRDYLIKVGLAVRVCCKGEDGYNAALPIAHSICKAMEENSN